MPITPTYPGVYIEELPSSNYAVTAAPTSVTVFIGWTNPFWIVPTTGQSPQPNTAVEVLSFSDYAFQFGGFFSSPWLPDYVGQAVSQFFNNGGSDAYVISLGSQNSLGSQDYWNLSASPPTDTGVQVTAAQATVNDFMFKAIQPVGQDSKGNGLQKISVAITNISLPARDTADITITYGKRVETYRRVAIAPPSGSSDSPVVTTINGKSQLVWVTPPAALPSQYPAVATTYSLEITAAQTPPDGSLAIDLTQIQPVFQANSSLDKLSVFNLMVLPGTPASSTPRRSPGARILRRQARVLHHGSAAERGRRQPGRDAAAVGEPTPTTIQTRRPRQPAVEQERRRSTSPTCRRTDLVTGCLDQLAAERFRRRDLRAGRTSTAACGSRRRASRRRSLGTPGSCRGA